MSVELKEPLLADGLRSINFFNGRLVSGEDLTAEQNAATQRLSRLGQAVGSGIAWGLQVVEKKNGANDNARPILTVSPGLAVNRCGQTIRLSAPTDVTLVQSARTSAAIGDAPFTCCVPLKAAGSRLADTGVYLLTIAPAIAREGRAPVNGLGNDRAKCNSKYFVEGVQFNLLELDVADDVLATANRTKLRNRVAYACFGAAETDPLPANPFSPAPAGYGLIDRLRPDLLSDCAVPLAVVFWTAADGVGFIDHWSARRRITAPTSPEAWPLLLGDRGASESEAMFLQFQEQIEAMRLALPDVPGVVATQYFDRLPPVGLLPMSSPVELRGFVLEKFLAGRTYRRTVFIEGARLRHVLRTALGFPPIDLAGAEMVWLYAVRENIQPQSGGAARPAMPYLIFVSGHVPFLGEPRLDVSHSNYSHFV